MPTPTCPRCHGSTIDPVPDAHGAARPCSACCDEYGYQIETAQGSIVEDDLPADTED